MDIAGQFLYHCVVAGVTGLVFFSLPGAWVSVLLGINWRVHQQPTALFSSLALGMSCYGIFALGFTWCVGLSIVTLVASWVLFQALAAGVYARWLRHDPLSFSISLSPLNAGFLVLAGALYALLPALSIYPGLYQDGLFVNPMLFDHNKMAIASGIAREGLPALNPYYAPLGERIPLIYYYGWHFLVAAIKLLTGVPVWSAEIALVWLTALATVLLLVWVVVYLTARRAAAWGVLAFALTSMLPGLFSHLFGARAWAWLGYPENTHPFELLWLQLSWCPQHVYSAMCVLLLLFLVARAVAGFGERWVLAGCVGLVSAAAFSSSVWVGGIGIVWMLPFMVVALWRLPLDYSRLGGPVLLAVVVCVLFAMPILLAELSGPSAAKFPLGVTSYTATRLFDRGSGLNQVGHILLYWLQFLPLNLGFAYLLGLPAVLAFAPKHPDIRAFKVVSVVALFSYLFAAQFFKSRIGANDFAWRAVLVPMFLLFIWASVALAELPNPINHSRWRPQALLLRWHRAILPIGCIGLTLGMLSTAALWTYPQPDAEYDPPNPEQLVEHQEFFHLRHAWDAVRNYTQPNELVQNNPDSFTEVLMPRLAAPMAMVLFGDRPMAYAGSDTVQIFAHSYAEQQKETQYAAVQALFKSNPSVDALRYARDTLHIKALIIHLSDPVWSSTAIEDSGVYRLAEQQLPDHYKIYVAQ